MQAGLGVSEFLESRRKLPLLTQPPAPTWEGYVALDQCRAHSKLRPSLTCRYVKRWLEYFLAPGIPG